MYWSILYAALASTNTRHKKPNQSNLNKCNDCLMSTSSSIPSSFPTNGMILFDTMNHWSEIFFISNKVWLYIYADLHDINKMIIK